MKLTLNRRAEPFMAVAGSWLAADEPASSMLLGVCFELLSGPRSEPGTEPRFVTVEQSGEILMVGVQASPYGLIVHPRRDLTASTQEALVGHFSAAWEADGLALANILGPMDLVQDLAAAWVARRGGSCHARLRMRLYSLRCVAPPPPRAGGHLRRADAGDETLVKRWFYDFSREALGDDSVGAAHGTAHQLLWAGEVYLWQEETVMAMVAQARATATSAFVGYAYTPPETRGRGLATCCVAALSQLLLDRGFERCVLFTDLNNPVTNRIYPRVGYRARGDYYQMALSTAH